MTMELRRKPVATATPLLPKAERSIEDPQSWPNSPREIQDSLQNMIWSDFVDLVLLGCSVAFFSFGLLVLSYDQASTRDHPHANKRLFQASEYVFIRFHEL